MTRDQVIDLAEESALVLQQIRESGEEDFNNLADNLRLPRKRLALILQDLRQQRLVLIRQSLYSNESWIRLSSKGRQLLHYIWPETVSYV